MYDRLKTEEDWSQKFGNTLFGMLMMFFVMAIGMFFYEGCSYQSTLEESIVTPKEEEKNEDPEFNASDWILFK